MMIMNRPVSRLFKNTYGMNRNYPSIPQPNPKYHLKPPEVRSWIPQCCLRYILLTVVAITNIANVMVWTSYKYIMFLLILSRIKISVSVFAQAIFAWLNCACFGVWNKIALKDLFFILPKLTHKWKMYFLDCKISQLSITNNSFFQFTFILWMWPWRAWPDWNLLQIYVQHIDSFGDFSTHT